MMGGHSYSARAGGPGLVAKTDENRDLECMATTEKLLRKSAAPAVHQFSLRSLGMVVDRVDEEPSNDSTGSVVRGHLNGRIDCRYPHTTLGDRHEKRE